MSLITNKLKRSLLPVTSKLLQTTVVRHLNLLEYQSKELLHNHGVKVQKFKTVSSLDQVRPALNSFAADEYVIKAQILAGGRGKGIFDNGFKGGVHITKNQQEVEQLVEQMLGNRLITQQTPRDGIQVNKIMIAESVTILRETYLSILMDRSNNGPVLVSSVHGGVDIEAVAKSSPESIKITPIDIHQGLTMSLARQVAESLQFKGELVEEAAREIVRLYKFFEAVDAVQVEINPLAETEKHGVVSVDAKIAFDDNAKFRQENIFKLEDPSELDPKEVEAAKHNLNYIALDGNIGCLVNGAGLAMATMDIIKLQGGEPANFLDVGGGVKEEQVQQAFRLLTSDTKVKAILINVFGGIVNCATIANGIVGACRKIDIKVPLVVRLEGTNAKRARDILKESGLPIITAGNLDEAAKLAVQSVRN